MKDIPISICIPAYKTHPDLLLLCLKSVFESIGSAAIDVVVCEQGEEDLSFVKEHYSAVRIIHCETPSAYLARVKLFGCALGSFVWFVDADDGVLPHAITSLISAIRAHPDTDIFMFEFSSGTAPKNPYRISPSWKRKEPSELIDSLLSSETDNAVWKKILSKRLSPYFFETRISMGEDKLLCLCFAQQAKNILSTTTPFYWYRFNPDSATQKFKLSAYYDWAEMTKIIYQSFGNCHKRFEGTATTIKVIVGLFSMSLAKKSISREECRALIEGPVFQLQQIYKDYKKEIAPFVSLTRRIVWWSIGKGWFFIPRLVGFFLEKRNERSHKSRRDM